MRGLSSSLILQALLLVLMVHLSTQTQYLNSTEDICRLFKDGTKLRKPGTCNEWIECKGFATSESGTCDSQYFNLANGACNKKLDTSYCSTSSICTSSTKGYMGDTLNCANWYLCDGKLLKSQGACTSGMYFDQEKQMCVYPRDTVCTAKYEMCDIVPVGVAFRDEANCNKYFTCSSKFALVDHTCDTGKYFDVATATCVESKLVVCDNHPLPDGACGNKKLAVRNKFVSDGATCRGYLYCRDLGSGVPDPDPIRQQCGENYFFNQERQACMPSESQKCVHDRCDGRQDGFVVTETEGCHNYVECVDGREGTVFTCDNDEYYNVATQKCTATKTSYEACSA
ncbi:peritrophin-48 [Drosophila rhopaloa]|uniref:Peritrophin-48 n=1 Tax=Drosophila rhopaloa TaxID=1041015 RepID=A0A6P4FIG0_DRORH|nr:peritrophin-48 [Drosophila rhopaloa]